MRSYLILVAVAFMLHDESSAADPPVFAATYACNGFKLSLSGSATTGTLGAVYPDGKQSVAACTGLFTVTSNALTAMVDEPTGGNTEDCGYAVVDATATPKVRNITLVFLETAGIIQSTDKKAVFECAEDAIATVQKTVTFTAVTGEPTGTFTPTKGFELDFKIVEGATTTATAAAATAKTAAALNDKLKFAGSVKTAGIVKEIKIISCSMKPASQTTPTVKIVGADGCPDTTNKLYKSTTEEQAKPTSAKVTVNSKENYMYLTAAFPIAKFLASTQIEFECTVQGCVTAADTACAIPTTCNAARRRRDIAQTSNNTFVVRNKIYILDPALADFAKNGHKGAQLSSCLSHVSFISVVAILGVLLVVSLAVSVFFCSKLIRQNNTSQQKEAYPNPAYKA